MHASGWMVLVIAAVSISGGGFPQSAFAGESEDYFYPPDYYRSPQSLAPEPSGSWQKWICSSEECDYPSPFDYHSYQVPLYRINVIYHYDQPLLDEFDGNVDALESYIQLINAQSNAGLNEDLNLDTRLVGIMPLSEEAEALQMSNQNLHTTREAIEHFGEYIRMLPIDNQLVGSHILITGQPRHSTLGVAYVNSICTRYGLVVVWYRPGNPISASNGFQLISHTLAHELGHNFSARHLTDHDISFFDIKDQYDGFDNRQFRMYPTQQMNPIMRFHPVTWMDVMDETEFFSPDVHGRYTDYSCVTRLSHLQLSMSGNNIPDGNYLGYQLTLTNKGFHEASDVTFTLEHHELAITNIDSGSADCTDNGQELICNVESIASDKSINISFDAGISAPMEMQASIDNQSLHDGDLSDNWLQITTALTEDSEYFHTINYAESENHYAVTPIAIGSDISSGAFSGMWLVGVIFLNVYRWNKHSKKVRKKLISI